MDNSDGASQWRDSEVLDLINIWGDTSIQAKLEGSYRNRSVFEKIAHEMEERGHRRTWLQCQRKVKSLKSKFKEANDSNNRSGRGRITCPFYNEISRVMGDKPSCQPLELLDSYEAGEEEPETPRSSADSLDIDVETDDTSTESLPSASSVSSAPSTSGESSSAAGITETTGRSTTASKSSGTTSAKSRKRKTKMEATLEIFTEKISSALNNTDDTELQLKMQAAQHEHELKMLSMFTQFLARSNSPCPPFYQAPVQPSQYNPRQLPPQPTFYNFTQPPKFSMGSPQPPPCNETTNQPLSFLQDLAQPFNHPPAHPPDIPHSFSQVSAHPQGPAQQPFNQASGHPPFYRPPDDQEK
ncbi:uncharacterized protein LOC130091953 [Rhinichthys klamathensis goyatoka]|uniref:uncharacterized protein LOC130091953 n=1 Tax=Rhinichthys klamathensis goyatoka TaxID=3034132 RepID=UPI0024B5C3BC|nr:uncharacterized protein LOC130091953 [Rhinichthys klamathensis goyatoka]